MRIGVISDTHIPERAKELPPEILDEFKKVDMVIHAGDLTELSVLEELRNSCANINAVWGNMDPPQVREKFPQKLILQAAKYKIGVMHGYGAPNNLVNVLADSFKEDNVDMIIFGHAHSPFNQKVGPVLFFNPGSATDKVFAPYNSYGIVEINEKIEAKIIKLP